MTICDNNLREHDANLARFKKPTKKYSLTQNEKECVYRITKIKLLRYEVSKGVIISDPKRLRPMQGLPPQKNLKRESCLCTIVRGSKIIHKRCDK